MKKPKETRTRFHIINKLREDNRLTPLSIYGLIAGFVFLGILIFDLILKPDKVDILVEFHGLFFDLVVFGIILTIYDTWKQRRERISTLLDQLDDFWDWETDEGILRKVGIIKRLIEMNYELPRMTAIRLSGADFFNLEFTRLIFQNSKLDNSKFNWAKLTDSFFSGSDFRNSNFEYCKFYKSTIAASDFENANLRFCNFIDTVIRGNVSFQNANLHSAVFENTQFKPEAFGYPDFTNADLSMANLYGADLTHCKGLTKDQIESARTDENTKLPDCL